MTRQEHIDLERAAAIEVLVRYGKPDSDAATSFDNLVEKMSQENYRVVTLYDKTIDNAMFVADDILPTLKTTDAILNINGFEKSDRGILLQSLLGNEAGTTMLILLDNIQLFTDTLERIARKRQEAKEVTDSLNKTISNLSTEEQIWLKDFIDSGQCHNALSEAFQNVVAGEPEVAKQIRMNTQVRTFYSDVYGNVKVRIGDVFDWTGVMPGRYKVVRWADYEKCVIVEDLNGVKHEWYGDSVALGIHDGLVTIS